MSVFGAYSRYYDLLYKDKDYAGEVAFVEKMLGKHTTPIKTILELGCGTGKHAVLLAQRGYTLHGIDRSEEMLIAAEERKKNLPADIAGRLSFSQGDVQDARAPGAFDAVVSLFHVVSYQTSNDALISMFTNAAAHLKPGGVFLFDYWYGPAVLTERPAERSKHMESDTTKVVRQVKPQLHTDISVVDVNYDIQVTDKQSGATERLKETHHMRYLFLSEIDFLARACGFTHESCCEWMTGKAPSDKTWGVCSILVKQ